jgi:hypothetical protein
MMKIVVAFRSFAQALKKKGVQEDSSPLGCNKNSKLYTSQNA